VLYRGEGLAPHRGGVFTNLLGVDLRGGRAWLTRERSTKPEHFEVVEIELSPREPVKLTPLDQQRRWIAHEAAAPLARMRAFAPLDPSADRGAELARYASIVEATGPFVTQRRDGVSGPHMAVSRELIAFEHGPDHLYLARRDGSGFARYDVGLSAAYDPALSPDGSRLAFHGCVQQASPLPGRYMTCPYYLYLGEARRGARPTRVAGVFHPQPPVWSLDGRFVYTVTRDSGFVTEPRDRGGCVFRVDAEPPHRERSLWCTREHRDLSLYLEPSGETAVVEATRGEPGRQVVDFVWLALPEGAVKRTVSVERGTSLSSLGPRGLLAAHAQGHDVFIDLTSGDVARVPRPRNTLLFYSSVWTAEGEVLAHRYEVHLDAASGLPIDELVALDVERLARGAAMP
jgi:hypothetical protein